MFLLTIVGVVLCFVLWIYMRWLRYKRYWADRGVPHLPPVPILGSLSFLQRENMNNWFRRMKEQFDSPYVGIWVFWRPGLIVNSPEIARNILVKDFDNFRNRLLGSGDSDPIGSLNIFTSNDHIWTSMRRQLTGIFTAAKLRNLQRFTRSKAEELIQRIKNDQNIKIELKCLCTDYTTDVIGTAAFGVRSNATLTGGGPLRDVTESFSKYSIYRGISFCSIFFFPELVDIFRFKFFPSSSEKYFKKIYHTVTLQREANQNDTEPRDLVDTLLKIKRDNKSYSEEMIISQAAILLLGGYETSATLMTFIIYELAFNHDIQDKLYQELVEARVKNGSDEFDIQVLTDLTYLDCVIKEGLRKYTTMGWLDRVATNDYKIDDKLTIEAGTVVYVNSIGMHYDPKYFPEPDKFNPDRFLPENKNNIQPFTYMPFGEGPRFCIGKRFGLMTLRFALTLLFLNFNIRPFPDSPKPSDMKFNTIGIFLAPGESLFVDFVPRK